MFLLVVVASAIFCFVGVPALIYLFVLDTGLSERELMHYVTGLVAFQIATTALLVWWFRIITGPWSGNRDAR